MVDGICLILLKGERNDDISQLVEQIRWSGRKGSSSRKIDVTLIDDDGYNHARSGIDVEEGQQCILRYNNEEIFQGIIMSQTQSSRKQFPLNEETK